MFYFIFILILALCNVTLFFKGFSYIGYAIVISFFVGYFLFSKEHNVLKFSILSSAFVLSILNVFTEIVYKFDVWHIFNPVKYDFLFLISIIYLTISVISGWLWKRKKAS